jgi:predicted permease
VIYQIIGCFTSLAVAAFFWVPHRFRWGIVVAGIWGNYGDVPTAIIMSITAAAPFRPQDQTLAVAYIAAFLLVYMVRGTLSSALMST